MSAPSTNLKDYLGDSVYADVGTIPGEVILTTENGVEATNTIIMEPSVVKALVRWLKRTGNMPDD